MHPFFYILLSLFIATVGCGSPKGPASDSPSAETGIHATAPPPKTSFDIRVFANPGKSDSTAQIILVTEVDIPEGSYVISALSDRDYLGKFNVTWEDSTIVPAGSLVESPLSMPGWEPFDQVYTPMLTESTTLSQPWNLPAGIGPFSGQVFFVLEPRCVPYALDFTVEKEPDGWSSTYGMVYQAQPD